MKKVLLYSGGMDSFIINHLWKPDVILFFRIHTVANTMEYSTVMKQVKNGVIDSNKLKVVDINLSEFEQVQNNYYLPLRNLYFVTLASNFGDVICLGATGSSTHLDKNEHFCKKSMDIINYLLQEDGRSVSVVIPYHNMSKIDMVREYLNTGGDINILEKYTCSCYSGEHLCLNCTSCASKFTALYRNGYKFDTDSVQKFKNFVRKNSSICKSNTVELYKELLVK